MPPPLRPPLRPPSPQFNTIYSGPGIPTAYDTQWQYFTNLTAAQVAWFQAQPEWVNFVAWVALDPPNATDHAHAPDAATINAALAAAGQTVMVNPLPLPPTPAPVVR